MNGEPLSLVDSAPAAAPPLYPSFWQAVRLLLLAALLTVVFSIPLALLDRVAGTTVVQNPLGNATVSLLSLGVILILGLRRTGVPFREVFALTPIRVSFLPPMACSVLGLGLLLSEFDNVLRRLLPAPDWVARLFTNLIQPEEHFLATFIALVVVPPLTEEFLFRGLILRGFLGRYSLRKAALVSAALFALFHLIPWQIPGAFAWGVLFAWWYVRLRSLVPCLLGHALANLLPLLAAASPLELPGFTGSLSDAPTFQPLWLDVSGALLFGLGIWLLLRMFERPADIAIQKGES